jgi:hypothetical protein
MDICKTDYIKVLRYLEDAQQFYGERKELRYKRRAWAIKQITKKLNKKLKENDKTRHH